MRVPTRSAVLLVAAALCGGAAGCGSDDDAPRPTTTAAVPSQEARGLNFAADVPKGWTDISAQVSDAATRYDLAVGDTTAKGYKSTLLVLRDKTPAAPDRTIGQVDDAAFAAAQGEPGVRVSRGPALRLDGADARQVVVRRTQRGVRLAGRRVIALHRDELYSIQLVTEADDPRAERLLRDFVASWRWTG